MDKDSTEKYFDEQQLQGLALENETSPTLQYDKENQELIYQNNGVSKRFSAWFSVVPPLIAIDCIVVVFVFGIIIRCVLGGGAPMAMASRRWRFGQI